MCPTSYIISLFINAGSPVQCCINVIFPSKTGNTFLLTKDNVSERKYCITSGIFMVVWANCAEPANPEMG